MANETFESTAIRITIAQMNLAHLVVYLLVRLGELNRLLKAFANLIKLAVLGPVVKGSGHVDLGGRMGPGARSNQLLVNSREMENGCFQREGADDKDRNGSLGATYHVNLKLPILADSTKVGASRPDSRNEAISFCRVGM
jgi:hypothetical protein